MNHLGIIIALLPEAAHFSKVPVKDRPVRISENISLMVSGMGQTRAANAARLLYDSGVDAMLCTGTAGALSTRLQPGGIVIPGTIFSGNGKSFEVSDTWHAHTLHCFSDLQIPLYTEGLFSTDQVINHTEDKQRLAVSSGAIAIDMESAAVMEFADIHGIPAMSIRTIVDPLMFSIPDAVLRNTDVYGVTNRPALLKSLLFEPKQIPGLLSLARHFNKASASMELINQRIHELFME